MADSHVWVQLRHYFDSRRGSAHESHEQGLLVALQSDDCKAALSNLIVEFPLAGAPDSMREQVN